MSARPPKLDFSGHRLGGYDLLHRIASGGMGAVYAARAAKQGGFERLFALKVCHPFLVEEPSFVDMFLDEARIAALVRHPNVVGTIDVGTEQGLPYLVMDFVEGVTLGRLVKEANQREAQLPVPIVARLLLDVLAGLEATHEACDLKGQPLHLVHRDISPQNVLIGTDGICRVTDFGIAKAAVRSVHTKEGTVKGKFSYMAPEALRLERSDRRADLFAVGVLGWEILAGRRLFAGESDADTMQRVLSMPVPSIERDDLPPGLEDVLRKLLDRAPVHRYESAGAAARALQAACPDVARSDQLAALVDEWLGADIRSGREKIRHAASSSEASKPTPAPAPRATEAATQVRPAPRGRGAAVWVAIALVALGLVGAAWRFAGPSAPAEPPPEPAVAHTTTPPAPPPTPVPVEPEVAPAPAVDEAPPPVEPEVEAPAPAPDRRRRRDRTERRTTGGGSSGGVFRPSEL